MFHEIDEIPAVTAQLLENEAKAIKQAAASLRKLKPSFITTVGRGSSDHAASYFKYVLELTLGLPVASIGPSITSIYKKKLHLDKSVCIAISQSGESKDIVELVKSTAQQSAVSIAITNNPTSSLANACAHVIDIQAGNELSVPATKTFVTSVVAGLALIAYWKEDYALLRAIKELPESFEQAKSFDWPELREVLSNRNSLLVLGRGPSYAIAKEAALKFKETCQIHGEAYSAAEVMHGPVSIIEKNYPILAFAAEDKSEKSIISVVEGLALQGAKTFITSSKAKNAQSLRFARTSHPLTASISLIVSFYAFVNKLALERGLNPDLPRNLKKVTHTL